VDAGIMQSSNIRAKAELAKDTGGAKE